MLNPMGRTYQGYSQANQSLLEEEVEEEEEEEEVVGTSSANKKSSLFPKVGLPIGGARRVSWGESSRMSVLRPNVHDDDEQHDQDSSDDEVPQSFMVEAASPRKPPRHSKGKGREGQKHPSKPSLSRRSILPTTNLDPIHLSMPPRPSDIDPSSPVVDTRPQVERKQMRGLDAYERALWNWVNVYNLDAFLQDVYSYYEGKGIYCMALSRGLNLLSAVHLLYNVPPY